MGYQIIFTVMQEKNIVRSVRKIQSYLIILWDGSCASVGTHIE